MVDKVADLTAHALAAEARVADMPTEELREIELRRAAELWDLVIAAEDAAKA